MTDLVERLKACPFCGGVDLEYESRNAIECRTCPGGLIIGEMSFDLTAEEADQQTRAAWNRRPEPSPAPVGEWREAVARIIDQAAWSRHDEYLRSASTSDQTPEHIRRQWCLFASSFVQPSLAKADQISALGREGEQGTSHSQPNGAPAFGAATEAGSDLEWRNLEVSWEDAPAGPTLWGVYGPDCFPTVFACKLRDYRGGRDLWTGRAVWGFSVYEGEPGFRTLGTSKGWAEQHGLRLFLTKQAAFNHITSLFEEVSSQDGTTERQPSPREEQNPPRNLEREG